MIKECKPVGRPAIGTTKRVSLTLSDDVWKKLNIMQSATGKNLSALIRYIIMDYLNEGGEK